MGYRKDLTGKVFGRLTVTGYSHQKGNHTFWKCICECGNTCIVRGDLLNSGNTRSCSCYKQQVAKETLKKHGKKYQFKPTHGDSSTRFNAIYNHMVSRCTKSQDDHYKYYGQRGIRVLWNSYEEFKEDMYESYLEHCEEYGEKDTEIDRIDVNGNYCKENCRWVTNLEQANNRTNTVYVELNNGQLIAIADLARKLGIKYKTLYHRYLRSSYKGTGKIPYDKLIRPYDEE